MESKRLDSGYLGGESRLIEMFLGFFYIFFILILIGKGLALIGRILKILNDFNLLTSKSESFNMEGSKETFR